jgi:hypothetical protein
MFSDRKGALMGSCLVLSAGGYTIIGYLLHRHETGALLATYALLFALYLAVIKFGPEWPLANWLTAAVLLRLTLFVSWPSLSDDFYRFVWDGRLWAQGLHPFSFLPSHVLTQNLPGLDPALFEKLNSPGYYTIYPPVPQFLFWLSARLSPQSLFGSVLILRTAVVACEIFTMLLLTRLLAKAQMPPKAIYLYAFNPLVILELTGNVHMEGLSVCLMVATVYFVASSKPVQSGLAMALAVGTKLVPVLAGVAFLRFLGVRIFSRWAFVAASATVLMFIPLLSGWDGWRESLALYFNKFEFNASIYYVVREWGWWKYGYNIIQTAGWKLAAISGIMIIAVSLYRFRIWQNNFPSLVTTLLFVFTIHLFFSTTVHPWYIAPLVAWCVLTPFRYAIVWSGLVFLSYAGYTAHGYAEPLWFTTVEYVAVYGYLGTELWKNRSQLLRS